jgi:hypothetical protein
MREIRQGASTSFKIFFNTTDGKTGATGLTPAFSWSGVTSTMSTVGAPASTEDAFGWYDVGITTAHTANLGDVAFHSTGAGQDPVDFKIRIIEADWVDVSTAVSMLTTISTQVSDVYSAELGHWKLDTTANTLTMFRAGDTTTSIQVFNLTTIAGTIPGYIARTT